MSKHWCPQTKVFTTKEYRDLTSLTGVATGSAYPTKDSGGNLLETEYGLCEYMDHQTVHLQEMPERAPPGQLPRSIEVSAACQPVPPPEPSPPAGPSPASRQAQTRRCTGGACTDS